MAVSLDSFISPAAFNTEQTSNPLIAAMIAGTTYTPPVFNGNNQATSIDPGGLFGWLIYSRAEKASPAKGSTTDSYILYKDPNSFINDLNALAGTTYCLISLNTEGGTFGFFDYSGRVVNPKTAGKDFLYALDYLSYGGYLVISGNCTGLINYTSETSNNLDILIGQTANNTTARFVENNDYIIGVFPSVNDGGGFTAQNFGGLFNNPANVIFSQGGTASDRIFNVGGQSFRALPTGSLQFGTTIDINLSSVSDAAGAITRSKDRNKLPLTVAGSDLSAPLNNKITNVVEWTNQTTKNIYKKNRVNFYTKVDTNNLPTYFMGLDLVGATAGTNSTYTTAERFGPSYIRNSIERNVRNILLKYVFMLNNSSTRAAATTEISLYIQTLNQYLDTTYTNIVCSDANNDDNSTTLTANITVKPILSTTEYTLTVSASAD
jgi:hypothetical protein